MGGGCRGGLELEVGWLVWGTKRQASGVDELWNCETLSHIWFWFSSLLLDALPLRDRFRHWTFGPFRPFGRLRNRVISEPKIAFEVIQYSVSENQSNERVRSTPSVTNQLGKIAFLNVQNWNSVSMRVQIPQL